ncbi:MULTISPECIES: hypothetical protein [Nocardiopsis]|uniref:Uncharacterized protein n=1 Tax=Nocardiopsis dassonvillei (strain ATCC 23218 / DSM 43111 / CIP 107115 / JCM 7437 / KCTC 9190 / NBRC 14626 / NCTC 10488 / NRRL B-5397 / IMRU 509) TaxID=446468 RepID=D7B7M2_NOCDD|nr:MULTISPECIES: hypothetical protein [Nocardiopsis]ADH69417.1 hypothetical protein Ndas_4020 [Nocardiopsis dassonvillei subsp. dassonvillei DSM 43111]APC37431.1 hypothetical protein A9R04_23365 [Nocardiopsis dassonvillei]NKY79169.1 hypothetical protein [Nocardiopsis dassonvillei]VEI89927.1 Uncharacterised protein [Nocardiopsis dassonvillei]
MVRPGGRPSRAGRLRPASGAPRALPADSRRPGPTGSDAPGALTVTAGPLLLVLDISRGQSVGWAFRQSTAVAALPAQALTRR